MLQNIIILLWFVSAYFSYVGIRKIWSDENFSVGMSKLYGSSFLYCGFGIFLFIYGYFFA